VPSPKLSAEQKMMINPAYVIPFYAYM
jgi:hypothetical protein